MDELRVKRWRRYGEDRLYVTLPEGGRVGWLDLRTGEATLEREDLREAFERAIADHAAVELGIEALDEHRSRAEEAPAAEEEPVGSGGSEEGTDEADAVQRAARRPDTRR